MEKEYIVKLLKKGFITHNVKNFVLEKPEGYEFIPGQATDTSINGDELKNEKRSFTFTSKNNDLVLEFIIKKYDGITKKFHELSPGNEMIIREPFGAIHYEKPGVFIAGGTGITPFLSIFRNIENEEIGKNKLIFSNKTHKDIICEEELMEIFKDNVIFLLTEEKRKGYFNRRISKSFLEKNINDFSQYFYICGPDKFVKDVKNYLIKLGVKEKRIIFEK